MIKTGTVVGSELKNNKDGLNIARMLQVQLSEAEDIQDVQLITEVGNESVPEIGSEVIVISINRSFKIAIASDDLVIPTMNSGEKKLYSTANRVIMAFIDILNTGVINLSGTRVKVNGEADFAVRYLALNTAIQTFATSINTAIASAIVGHTHGGVAPGSGTSLVGAGVFTPATANISSSRVEEVTLP